MTRLPTVAAELRKLATLPAARFGLAAALAGPVAVTTINARLYAGSSWGIDDPAVQASFDSAPLGAIGAAVVAVVVVSSEYAHARRAAGSPRQISASLAATPGRWRLLGAKLAAVAAATGLVAAVTTLVSLVAGHLAAGEQLPAGSGTDVLARSAGVVLFVTFTAVAASSVTVLCRSAVIPLVMFIGFSSVVSPTVLLARVTTLAHYLPDSAGLRMFVGDSAVADGGIDPLASPLGPLAGGLVMAAWVAALVVTAAVAFARRDA